VARASPEAGDAIDYRGADSRSVALGRYRTSEAHIGRRDPSNAFERVCDDLALKFVLRYRLGMLQVAPTTSVQHVATPRFLAAGADLDHPEHRRAREPLALALDGDLHQVSGQRSTNEDHPTVTIAGDTFTAGRHPVYSQLTHAPEATWHRGTGLPQ